MPYNGIVKHTMLQKMMEVKNMANNSKNNFYDIETINSYVTKTLDLRGTNGDSFYNNHKSRRRDRIAQYFFSAETPQGVIRGSDRTDHHVWVPSYKKQTMGVFIRPSTNPECGESQKKLVRLSGKMLIIWTYAHDPYTVEVMYVDSINEPIQTMYTQFNCFDGNNLFEILKLCFGHPLFGSLDPMSMIPGLPCTISDEEN